MRNQSPEHRLLRSIPQTGGEVTRFLSPLCPALRLFKHKAQKGTRKDILWGFLTSNRIAIDSSNRESVHLLFVDPCQTFSN